MNYDFTLQSEYYKKVWELCKNNYNWKTIESIVAIREKGVIVKKFILEFSIDNNVVFLSDLEPNLDEAYKKLYYFILSNQEKG